AYRRGDRLDRLLCRCRWRRGINRLLAGGQHGVGAAEILSRFAGPLAFGWVPLDFSTVIVLADRLHVSDHAFEVPHLELPGVGRHVAAKTGHYVRLREVDRLDDVVLVR